MEESPLEFYLAGHTILSNYKDLLSVADLTIIFEVSKQTIYKGLRDGQFGTPIKVGRAYKIPKIYVLRRYFCL